MTFMNLAGSNSIFRLQGKLATLWFDEIVLQVPYNSIPSVLEKVAAEEGWAKSTLDEILKIQVSANKYIPEYSMLSKNPWDSDNVELVKFAENITIQETRKMEPDIPESHPGFRHEVAWAGAGLIDGIELWLALNSIASCTFIPHLREHLVLSQLFSSEQRNKPFNIFSDVMVGKIPDLSNYSWDRIVELRHHPFFDKFREKITALNFQLDLGESESVCEIVEEIARKDMIEMIRMFRPDPSMSVIKALASNIPLPIPLNPASALFSVQDVKRQAELSRKYGWLYFMIDLN